MVIIVSINNILMSETIYNYIINEVYNNSYTNVIR